MNLTVANVEEVEIIAVILKLLYSEPSDDTQLFVEFPEDFLPERVTVFLEPKEDGLPPTLSDVEIIACLLPTCDIVMIDQCTTLRL
ncbi:hypothetical protein ScPMuIL_015640 [Solemya velum]